MAEIKLGDLIRQPPHGVAVAYRDSGGRTVYQGRPHEPYGPWQVKAEFQINGKLHKCGQGVPPYQEGWSVDSEGGLYVNGRCIGTFLEAQADIDRSDPYGQYMWTTPQSLNAVPPPITGRCLTRVVAIIDFSLYTEVEA